jgi:SsrA-binding protein
MAKETFLKEVNIRNRKASFEYEFIDKYIAGIILTGTEIKSIRLGKVNMLEAFCFFKNGELWVKQLHISPYSKGTHYNHQEDRERKLLLQKKELRKLESKSEEKGMTIIPIRVFVNENGFAKIEIAMARGKKLYDKREDIKEKDVKREMQRIKF